MQLIGAVLPGARRFRRVPLRLSPEATRRLGWLDWYRTHGRNARLTCRHFGISPDTLYRWRRRFHPGDLRTLEDDSRRPDRVRQPEWRPEVVARVQYWRTRCPRWGKKKVVVLLAREDGLHTSESTVGRVLTWLRVKGRLVEPPRLVRARAARRRPRPWARRVKAVPPAAAPGDLVELDTLVAEIVAGVRRWQFTAWDKVSKWSVVEAYSRATSRCGKGFLDAMRARFPFPLRCVQVDGGSEFMKDFEAACQAASIPLVVLPPKSPKLNGGVERMNRTSREEFYEVEEVGLTLPEHNAQLRAQEERYNTFRPHEALGQRTPLAALVPWPEYQERARKVYGIY